MGVLHSRELQPTAPCTRQGPSCGVWRRARTFAANPASVLCQQFLVACCGGMTLALGMAELVFRHVHHEPGNRSHGRVCARACAGPVLPFLVVSLPLQAKFQASLLAMLRVDDEPFHLVLFNTTTKSKSTAAQQCNRKRKQCCGFCKLPSFSTDMQRQIPPTKWNEGFSCAYSI